MVVPQLLVEHCDPAALGLGLGVAPPLVLECVRLVMEAVPDPSLVRLVLTDDFISSVNARQGMSGGQYTLERGSGLVGGKTLPNDLGGSDIVLHAFMFAVDPAPGVDPANVARLVLRTVAHEAQHAATHQLETPYASAPETSWRMSCLEALADMVIDEYRAESRVDPALRASERVWDGEEVVEEGRHAIGLAIAEYQEHRDINRLIDDVMDPFSIMVKALSILLATETLPDAAHVHDQQWEGLAAPVWTDFADVLDSARPIPLDGATRDAAVVRLADVLNRWLVLFDLTWTDVSFRIADFASYAPELPPTP